MDEEEKRTTTPVKPVIKLPDTSDRVTQDFGSLLPNPSSSLVPEVRKPHYQWFIRVHPTWNLKCYMFEDSTDQSIYLVSRYLKKDFSDVLHKKMLCFAITRRDKVLFIWPVNLGNIKNTYNRTAKEAVELAKTTWIRMYSDERSRSYKTTPAQDQFPEPKWPSDKNLDDLVIKAFEGKTITDENHPVLRRIRGFNT